MKFTLSWLKEHLKTDASTSEVVEAMTLAGLEVEGVENPAEKLSAFSIAKVVSAEKHPDADRLKVCQVETRDGLKQIVCGAPNARAGMTVAFAPLGAFIPGLDFSLDKKPRKIRGVESSGMMCSSKELEMGDDHDGIMDLDDSFEMGMSLADALGLNDPVIDFEVTPNRPDWLGVDNIARDLSATGLGTWVTPAVKPVKGSFPCPVTIETDAPDACPVFAGRVIRGIKNGPSPEWLQTRLKAIGLRPISALVDITNLISYDRARPLHVYDVTKLSGTIRARLGNGETFEALDDKQYTCSTDMCVIADDARVLGLGGVMGGTYSGVTADTTDVFIESAYFDPMRTRRTGRATGITSDAKYRFERGVDTGFVLGGLEMATGLVLDLCGGEASDVCVAGEVPAAPAPIEFDPALNKRLTGFDLSDKDMIKTLEDLGFGVKTGETWMVTVPSHRRDCTMGADLVEEIARIHGLHNMVAESLPVLQEAKREQSDRPGNNNARREPLATDLQNKNRRARRALAGQGLSEAVTWSFVAQAHAELFGGGDVSLQLDNPISPELSTMRPTALIHLLLAGQRSADKGYPGAALFEAGPTYQTPKPDGQSPTIAGMRRVETVRHWQGNSAPDALSAKADAVSALKAMGAKVDNLQIAQPSGSYWHPGRSGRLQMGPKNILADFGELHPAVLKAMGIEGRVCAFEIWPGNIPPARKKGKSKGALVLSDLMPVHRDFAFIVPEATPADKLIRAVKGADKALISDVTLFDVYQGKGVEPGYKSLALDVTLSPKAETLTDKDIESVSTKIIAQAGKMGAVLRG
ncbi:MAG: phenylalanine--tRNA ligase subunit beta [Robiginitomaculum sp.]|nr:phenylalanine--tRNA ligase subunit beta [Robiginitomaculum sp.]